MIEEAIPKYPLSTTVSTLEFYDKVQHEDYVGVMIAIDRIVFVPGPAGVPSPVPRFQRGSHDKASSAGV